MFLFSVIIRLKIESFENKVSLCSKISHSGYFFCPIDNRTVLLFYNHGSDIGCKKIVYNEGEFTVTDITVTGSIYAAYFTNSEYAWNWEYGNGGTLVKSRYDFQNYIKHFLLFAYHLGRYIHNLNTFLKLHR